MLITNGSVVILRAGVITQDSIKRGAEWVDTIDKVYNLSVQASPKTAKQDAATVNQLLAAVPNQHYALTFASNIIKKGGTITKAPVPGNPYHALVSNITVDDLYAIFNINKH